MKRKIAFLLALLSVANFAACGDSGNSNDSKAPVDDTTTQTPETELTDGLGNVDLEEFTINILHHNDEWLTWAKTQLIPIEENDGELINDAIYKRNSYIEERFNCHINIEEVAQVESIFRSLVMSGDSDYDVIFQYGLNVLKNIEYLADFNNIPHLSLDSDWWNPAATEVFRVGDKQLAVAGNWTLSYLSGAMAYCFNTKIWEDLNTGYSLYELVDEGKWTTDAFYAAAKNAQLDLNGDGDIKPEDDLIGVVGQCKSYWNSLIIGAGFRYVGFDNDHNPYFSLKSDEKMINFLQKIVEVESANEYIFPITSKMTNLESSNGASFEDGHALFNQTTILGIESGLREMETDFGILPVPKYDESQEKYMSYANIGEIATLPRSYDESRAENIGIILEAMSFYSQQNIVPIYRETVLQVKTTRDENSARMLDHIFEAIVFDYGTVVWQNDITAPIVNNYLLPRSTTLISTIDSLSSTLEQKISDLLEAVENVP